MKLSRLFLPVACLLLLALVSFNAPDFTQEARGQEQSATPTLGCAPAAAGRPVKLPAGCKLPFDAIKTPRAIDRVCPTGGCGELGNTTQQPTPHQLMNLAKNNFCATNRAAAVSYLDFVNLQQASNKLKASQPSWWTGLLPSDRTKLPKVASSGGGASQMVGEGVKVTFVGFIREAKYDDTETGEDVNCKIGGQGLVGTSDNDIHISIGLTQLTQIPAATADRCQSLTAEISPHFRPAVWEKIASPASRQIFQTHPVRITGTLMMDAEHVPCVNGTIRSGNPVRISVWEIHPVYAIDVCKNTDLKGCGVADASVWTPFDKYRNSSRRSAARD
jgi:hypothetical protein